MIRRGLILPKCPHCNHELTAEQIKSLRGQLNASLSSGRGPSLDPEQQAEALRLLDEGKSIDDVAKRFGVSGRTIYRIRPRKALTNS